MDISSRANCKSSSFLNKHTTLRISDQVTTRLLIKAYIKIDTCDNNTYVQSVTMQYVDSLLQTDDGQILTASSVHNAFLGQPMLSYAT